MQRSEERMAASTTADFLRTAEQLRKLVDKHEKDRKTSKHSRRNDLRDCFNVLEEFENHLNMELKAESIRVQQQLQKLRNSVYRFQGHLTDVKPSLNLIEKLKDIMGEIESSIAAFKEQQHKSFEEFLKEERTCGQEINAFERKVEAWSLPVKIDGEFSTVPNTKHCMGKKGREEFPAEVLALETFLQKTGGLLGGWDQYDHQSFLKVWTKHNGKPSYREEVKFYLPDKLEDDIKMHEDWYIELCHLQEKRKEAIRKWRAERLGKRERLQQENQSDETNRKEQIAVAAEAQRLKQEEERREAALLLEAWREQRRQQQEHEEQQRLREEVLQRKKLKEEQRRQQEVKLAVVAHVRQKKEEEELKILEKELQEEVEKEERRRQAAEGIKSFQARDLQKLETKLQKKQAKDDELLERLKKQAKLKEKVESHISRDPSRLWKPTKGWEERTKEIGPTGGGPVHHMFHRAIPAWRQDL